MQWLNKLRAKLTWDDPHIPAARFIRNQIKQDTIDECKEVHPDGCFCLECCEDLDYGGGADHDDCVNGNFVFNDPGWTWEDDCYCCHDSWGE